MRQILHLWQGYIVVLRVEEVSELYGNALLVLPAIVTIHAISLGPLRLVNFYLTFRSDWFVIIIPSIWCCWLAQWLRCFFALFIALLSNDSPFFVFFGD